MTEEQRQDISYQFNQLYQDLHNAELAEDTELVDEIKASIQELNDSTQAIMPENPNLELKNRIQTRLSYLEFEQDEIDYLTRYV